FHPDESCQSTSCGSRSQRYDRKLFADYRSTKPRPFGDSNPIGLHWLPGNRGLTFPECAEAPIRSVYAPARSQTCPLQFSKGKRYPQTNLVRYEWIQNQDSQQPLLRKSTEYKSRNALPKVPIHAF